MKTIKLKPHQIITLNDYPVHSDEVLCKYFNKCKLGEELPFVPVIRKEIVKKHFDIKLLQKFQDFESNNPKANYFMLDGSHRTTALTLGGRRITAAIYEDDKDISEAKKMVSTGKILKSGTLDHTLEENCEILNKHFKEKPYFMTVEQKTKRMVKERVLPRNMIHLC